MKEPDDLEKARGIVVDALNEKVRANMKAFMLDPDDELTQFRYLAEKMRFDILTLTRAQAILRKNKEAGVKGDAENPWQNEGGDK